MPELPEVETVVRGLRAPLIGRTITHMTHQWERTLQTPHPAEFAARIQGQSIQAVTRRAKFIVLVLSEDVLIVHLRMTGRLYVTEPDVVQDADRWLRVCFGLDDGHELRFSDVRKFGRVSLASEVEQITGALGPEPLDDAFTLAVFRERMTGRNKLIKPLLLDQTFIAGVGNIYADEALFRAGIHPQRRSNSLSDDETARLHETVRAALADGVQHEGASINWYRKADGTKGNSQDHFYVYGRDGQPCKTCGHVIEKIRVAQRGTHFCPVCQPIDSQDV